MGLAVSVGVVAELVGDDAEWAAELAEELRQELDNLSAAVAAEGVTWREPYDRPAAPRRENSGSFPYSWLHYLRRVLAMVDDGKPVTPVMDEGLTAEDEAQIEELTMMFESHLLCHSDDAGYYIPVELDAPLFLPEDSGVAGGGMVGSSQGLLEELRRCASALDIRLDGDGSLPDGEAARLVNPPDDADYRIESIVWLTLHEACRSSIAGGHAILFQ